MHVKRLKQLKRMLKRIPNDQLDLRRWITKQKLDKPGISKNLDCGSVCCVIGWACLYKPFNKEGLNLNGSIPTFKEHGSWNAVQQFFEIALNEAEWIASRRAYDKKATTKDVIRHIDALLEGKINP